MSFLNEYAATLKDSSSKGKIINTLLFNSIPDILMFNFGIELLILPNSKL